MVTEIKNLSRRNFDSATGFFPEFTYKPGFIILRTLNSSKPITSHIPAFFEGLSQLSKSSFQSFKCLCSVICMFFRLPAFLYWILTLRREVSFLRRSGLPDWTGRTRAVNFHTFSGYWFRIIS